MLCSITIFMFKVSLLPLPCAISVGVDTLRKQVFKRGDKRIPLTCVSVFSGNAQVNAKNSQILENIDESVYNISINPDGTRKIHYVSPQIRNIFGFTVRNLRVERIE